MADSVPTPRDVAQRGYSLALRRLSDMKATKVAEAMGTSDTTVSKLKNDSMEQVIVLLAHLGIKCVPADFKCVDPAAFEFLTASHARVLARAPELIWDLDE